LNKLIDCLIFKILIIISVLQEFPGMVFTAVAQLLARRWKTLPTVEKERYEQLSKQLKLAKKFPNNQRLNIRFVVN
jgi:hypothetical protein